MDDATPSASDDVDGSFERHKPPKLAPEEKAAESLSGKRRPWCKPQSSAGWAGGAAGEPWPSGGGTPRPHGAVRRLGGMLPSSVCETSVSRNRDRRWRQQEKLAAGLAREDPAECGERRGPHRDGRRRRPTCLQRRREKPAAGSEDAERVHTRHTRRGTRAAGLSGSGGMLPARPVTSQTGSACRLHPALWRGRKDSQPRGSRDLPTSQRTAGQ